ncbi:MAG TPA: (deoxy)nucleoside triphosphate pyrophosphohydrolase [Polyangiaceae bacterium]|nr:(deoxy)nucleoside triphosphate pyrophosphohydrolase [Polyangiaceae bacterium]
MNLASSRRTIVVVAGVIAVNDRVLVTQRPRGSHLEGAWEFPGGKVEDDEDPRDALRRELREELGVDAIVGAILETSFHRYDSKSVLLLFFDARLADGSPPPTAIEVADLRWRRADELRDEDFPPADVPVLDRVRAMLRR